MRHDMPLHERIERLMYEAGEAGDLEMVAICEAALDGDEAAWAACVKALADAEAMDAEAASGPSA